jgi:hypothetical protein
VSYLPTIYWEQAQPGNLGTCGIPMAYYSCWVCANAMSLTKMGHPECTPVHLNGIWTNGNPGYVDGCNGYAGLPDATYGDIQLTRQGWGADYARSVNPDTESATIGVDAWATLNYPTHYLSYDHTEPDGRVICGDPWVGDLCDVLARYGNVTTVDVYSGEDAMDPDQWNFIVALDAKVNNIWNFLFYGVDGTVPGQPLMARLAYLFNFLYYGADSRLDPADPWNTRMLKHISAQIDELPGATVSAAPAPSQAPDEAPTPPPAESEDEGGEQP